MAGKIYLFTWPEIYNLNQELKFWTSSFCEKFWSDSVDIYNSENRDTGKVNQSIFGWWLFSPKKMTVVKWLPVSADKSSWLKADLIEWFTENFMKNYTNIPDENIVIFVNPKPDSRLKFFKFFKNNWIATKEYPLSNDVDRKIFAKKKLGDIKISDTTLSNFLSIVGTDLYQIDSEIDKLREYCITNNIGEVSDDIVNLVTFGITEHDVFKFFDLAFHDTQKAIKHLENIQDEWTNRNEFAGALYSQLKTSIMINRMYQQWIKDWKEIASTCGLNPYSVYANLKNIKSISTNWIELENMYKYLVDTDYNIKTGKNDEREFWLNTKKMISKFKI